MKCRNNNIGNIKNPSFSNNNRLYDLSNNNPKENNCHSINKNNNNNIETKNSIKKINKAKILNYNRNSKKWFKQSNKIKDFLNSSQVKIHMKFYSLNFCR